MSYVLSRTDGLLCLVIYFQSFPSVNAFLVEGAGEMSGVWQVQDIMNKRYKNYIDFLVEDDRKLGKWHNVKITLTNENYETTI